MNILCILISSLLYIGCATTKVQRVNNDLTSDVKVEHRENITHIEKINVPITKEAELKQTENDKLKHDTFWVNICIGIVPLVIIIVLVKL